MALTDRTVRRAVTAICLDVCRRQDPVVPELPGLGDDLVHAVRFHRIAPLAHVALRETRPDLAALLAEDRQRAIAHHVRVTASLEALGDTLAGIAWAVVKGPVLSESLHPVAGLRSYGDVDLLVAPADLRAAGERMLRAGWQVLATRDDLLNGEVTGELELGHPAGAVVDLHWSLVLSETLRRRFQVPTVELLGRSTPVRIGPVEVCTLDDVDTLVHLCHHAAYCGAVRLLHLLDADQAARRIQDWGPVVERALSWGAGAQVGLVLARSRRLLDTPVPPDLGRRLGLSRGFARLGSVVDSAWPAPALRREASWPRLVARTAYPTATATAAAAARNAVLGAVNRVRPVSHPGRPAPVSRGDVDAWFTAVERVSGIPPAAP